VLVGWEADVLLLIVIVVIVLVVGLWNLGAGVGWHGSKARLAESIESRRAYTADKETRGTGILDAGVKVEQGIVGIIFNVEKRRRCKEVCKRIIVDVVQRWKRSCLGRDGRLETHLSRRPGVPTRTDLGFGGHGYYSWRVRSSGG
jgi:hypothetical protein